MSKLTSAIFRAYDIRGKYPLEINEGVVYKIIPSLISKLRIKNSECRIIVGHDARLSSPILYKTVLRSLMTSGYTLVVMPAGLITTPMLTFLVNHFKAVGGIMVTASHNPKEYNGLKVVGKNAEPIGGKEILNIMKREA